MIIHSELERMWKKAVVTYFKVSSQQLLLRTKENHKTHKGGQFCVWAGEICLFLISKLK